MSVLPSKTTRSTSRPADAAAGRAGPPPLEQGDRLSRAEFERRYEGRPEIKKAELVEGRVYLSSPVRYPDHGRPHADVVTWLGVYRAATPGVDGADNATVLLDDENEYQPDSFLRLEPAHGGRSRLTSDHYIEGPPELVVEIAASSASYDLHEKLRAYQRSGVQEYLVAQMYEERVDWFVLREGVYQPLAPDEQGVFQSEEFPGLWLQPSALWTADITALLAVLQEGIASPEHAGFVERLS
ncbi:MAG TPA: Uma2 family endonuclease [Armatimonadota bacterium]|nr:Uma2 family endonuclease [Armatimonadota bacterium]